MKKMTLVFALLLLVAAPVLAQQVGLVSVLARFSILDADGNETHVRVSYTGTPFEGTALAIYTLPDGSEIRDEMTGCALIDANGVWNIDCTNPHFVTWDGVYRHHYSVSSDRFTAGELQHFDISGEVDLQVRYLPRSGG